MWSRAIQVLHVLLYHPIQLPLAQDQHMVETFPPYAAQEAFTEGIRLGSTVRRSQDLGAAPRRHPSEGVPIFAIAIPDQKARHWPKRSRLPPLLRHPGIGGMPGDPTVHHAPRRELNDEKHLHRTKPKVNDWQEVAGPYLFRVILPKGRPSRREWCGGTNQSDVFLNRALGDGETELEAFPVEALGAVVAENLVRRGFDSNETLNTIH